MNAGRARTLVIHPPASSKDLYGFADIVEAAFRVLKDAEVLVSRLAYPERFLDTSTWHSGDGSFEYYVGELQGEMEAFVGAVQKLLDRDVHCEYCDGPKGGEVEP